MAGGVEIIAGTGGILGINIGATVREQLHTNSFQIGNALEELVRVKTHILTGALQESMTHDDYPDDTTDDLTFVYANDLQQLQEWNRIYVQYQEGGPLGEETYTNDPVMMFQDTADTDGLETVEAWALATTQDGLDLCTYGGGIPL